MLGPDGEEVEDEGLVEEADFEVFVEVLSLLRNASGGVADDVVMVLVPVTDPAVFSATRPEWETVALLMKLAVLDGIGRSEADVSLASEASSRLA